MNQLGVGTRDDVYQPAETFLRLLRNRQPGLMQIERILVGIEYAIRRSLVCILIARIQVAADRKPGRVEDLIQGRNGRLRRILRASAEGKRESGSDDACEDYFLGEHADLPLLGLNEVKTMANRNSGQRRQHLICQTVCYFRSNSYTYFQDSITICCTKGMHRRRASHSRGAPSRCPRAGLLHCPLR